MRAVALTIAYDGSAFSGWQRQANGTTIQGLVEAALTVLEGSPVTVIGAGRTDAGVHALGQVASVRLPACRLAPADLQRALNATLPGAIRILRVDEVPPEFNARFAARGKRYAYRIVNRHVMSPFEAGYAWHVPQPLDLAAMRAALAALVGTHDFAAFQAAGSRVATTVRTIPAADIAQSHDEPVPGLGRWSLAVGDPRPPVPGLGCSSLAVGKPRPKDQAPTPASVRATRRNGPFGSDLTIVLRGDGFLRHMVRNVVGTLVEVGRGRWAPEEMTAILASRDRGRAGPTAPAEGLFLIAVDY